MEGDMGTANGAPLDSLMAKVEELGRMCARLSQQNAELRAQVLSLHGGTARLDAPGARGSGQEGTVTRRVLGKALGAAAAGAVGAAALVDLAAQPAAASNGSTITAGNTTRAESRTAVLYDGSSGFGGVVLLGNDSTFDGGNAAFPAALGGWAGAGSTAGSGGVPSGIYGFTDNGAGYGVVGVNGTAVGANGSGVLGLVSDARVDAVTGVNNGTGAEAIGVHGVIGSTSPGGDSAGVRAENRGTGNAGSGVWASHAGTGAGVLAQSAGGIGLIAQGGNGVGVSASGASVGLAASGGFGVSAVGTTAVVATGQGANGVALAATADSTKPAVNSANSGTGAGVLGTSARRPRRAGREYKGAGRGVLRRARPDPAPARDRLDSPQERRARGPVRRQDRPALVLQEERQDRDLAPDRLTDRPRIRVSHMGQRHHGRGVMPQDRPARRARSTTSPRTAPTASLSAWVEVEPNENRRELRARASSAPMASRTWLGRATPAVHADPVEQAIPLASSSMSRASPSQPGKEKCAFPGSRAGPGGGPLRMASGTAASTRRTRSSRSAARRIASSSRLLATTWAAVANARIAGASRVPDLISASCPPPCSTGTG